MRIKNADEFVKNSAKTPGVSLAYFIANRGEGVGYFGTNRMGGDMASSTREIFLIGKKHFELIC